MPEGGISEWFGSSFYLFLEIFSYYFLEQLNKGMDLPAVA